MEEGVDARIRIGGGGGVRTHLGGGLGPNHLGDGGEIFTVAPDGCKATAGQNVNHFVLERPCSCRGGGPVYRGGVPTESQVPCLTVVTRRSRTPRSLGTGRAASSLLTLHRQQLLVRGPARVHLGGRLGGREHIWSHLGGRRRRGGGRGGSPPRVWRRPLLRLNCASTCCCSV